MHDIAAPSLPGRIAKVAVRFLAEIAISAIATLCVSVALSSYFWRESPGSPALPATSLAPPTALAGTPQSAPAAEAQAGEAANAILRRQLISPVNLRSSRLAIGLVPQTAPAAPSPRPRSSPARPRAHTAKPPCSGECAGHSLAAAHTPQAAVEAVAEPQPPMAPPPPLAALPLPERATDALLPPLPIPDAPSRLSRPAFRPVATVANLLSNLAGRW
jgi:hypothetical protein